MAEAAVKNLGPGARKNPFLESLPTAVANNRCGVCHSEGLIKYLECRSLDSVYAPIYMCQRCYCLYNATAEFEQLDVVEWQKRWAEDPNFYKVPSRDDFTKGLESALPTFDFFENDLGVKFSGSYLEVGAGSGMMAAAALSYFTDVYALDHVRDRLLQVREIVGEQYHVVDYDEALNIEADAVLIWHAMEHFIDPGGVFAFCVDRLKSSGYLLIQVPVFSEEHIYPGHYYFYNEITFSKMASLSGLEIHKFYYDYVINAITVAFRKP